MIVGSIFVGFFLIMWMIKKYTTPEIKVEEEIVEVKKQKKIK